MISKFEIDWNDVMNMADRWVHKTKRKWMADIKYDQLPSHKRVRKVSKSHDVKP